MTASAAAATSITIDDAELFNDKLRERDYYNFERPHGALDVQTPSERLKQKPANPDVNRLLQQHTTVRAVAFRMCSISGN